MEIRKLDDHRILLQLGRSELDPLASPILQHAETLSDTPLALARLIRAANHGNCRELPPARPAFGPDARAAHAVK